MNIAKNMEIIFIAAAVLLGATAYASAAIPAQQAAPAVAAMKAPAVAMQVVVVSAKRLSAVEKAALDR